MKQDNFLYNRFLPLAHSVYFDDILEATPTPPLGDDYIITNGGDFIGTNAGIFLITN